MSEAELKDIIEEFYKLLSDRILSKYGKYITEAGKEKLYNFDINEDIVVDSSTNTPIIYDESEGKIIVSNSFCNVENIKKLRSKYFHIILEDVKAKMNIGNDDLSLEELIMFSKELNIQEKDIIKSCMIQEILRMILSGTEISYKELVIMDGCIELFAHEIGNILGFVVTTPHRLHENLEIAKELNKIVINEFDEKIFNYHINDILKNVNDKNLLDRIDELTNEKQIVESTQDLTELSTIINNMTNVSSQISIIEKNGKTLIKFVDELGIPSFFVASNRIQFIKMYEELKKTREKVTKQELINALEENKNILYKEYSVASSEDEKVKYNVIKNETKYESGNISVSPSDGIYIKEGIVSAQTDENGSIITENPKEESLNKDVQTVNDISPGKELKINMLTEIEFKELCGRFDRNECTYEEMIAMQKYIDSQKEKNGESTVNIEDQNAKLKESKKRKRILIITIVIAITLTIVIGIFLGWLLFKLKK